MSMLDALFSVACARLWCFFGCPVEAAVFVEQRDEAGRYACMFTMQHSRRSNLSSCRRQAGGFCKSLLWNTWQRQGSVSVVLRTTRVVVLNNLLSSSHFCARSMIPHKTARGQEALKRFIAYEGIPAPYDTMKRAVVPDALKCVLAAQQSPGPSWARRRQASRRGVSAARDRGMRCQASAVGGALS